MSKESNLDPEYIFDQLERAAQLQHRTSNEALNDSIDASQKIILNLAALRTQELIQNPDFSK